MPRKEDRINYLNEVVLEFSSGKREARVSDLSPGGCYVDTIATLPEGESVSLVLRTPAGDAIPVTGSVAYVLPGFGFGIEFTDLSDEARGKLNELIKSVG